MKNMMKKISSKIVFKHPRIILVEDDILLSSGKKTSYLYSQHTGNAATIICKNSEGKILLQEEFNYPSRKKLLQFPGGSVDLEENLKSGANRELMEEAGYAATNLKLIGKYYLDNRRSESMMYVFYATELIPKEKRGDEEWELKTVWVDESEINSNIKNGKITNPSLLAAWSIYCSKFT